MSGVGLAVGCLNMVLGTHRSPVEEATWGRRAMVASFWGKTQRAMEGGNDNDRCKPYTRFALQRRLVRFFARCTAPTHSSKTASQGRKDCTIHNFTCFFFRVHVNRFIHTFLLPYSNYLSPPPRPLSDPTSPSEPRLRPAHHPLPPSTSLPPLSRANDVPMPPVSHL